MIGIEKSEAANRVSKAGLVPVVDDSKKADKREYEPGKVYAASARKGDTLPLKTEITLSAYGPRPMVVIPGVAGKTPDAAKSLLAGKDFAVGDPVPAMPRPESRFRATSTAPTLPKATKSKCSAR